MTVTQSEVLRVITDATLDRANFDVDTGALNWAYVTEDVKYFFRDEIAESAEFAMVLASEIFSVQYEHHCRETGETV